MTLNPVVQAAPDERISDLECSLSDSSWIGGGKLTHSLSPETRRLTAMFSQEPHRFSLSCVE